MYMSKVHLTKIFLTNGLSTLLIKGKPTFNNGPRILSGSPPNCAILDS